MVIEIKKAIKADAKIIGEIGKKAFRHAFGDLFNNQRELEEYLDDTYETNRLSRSLGKENNLYFLAFVDDQPVGFTKVKRHSLNELIESPFQMELQKIYVLPEFHGLGVGRELLANVKTIAKEIAPDFIWLDTHITNEKAITIYEHNGFRKMGHHSFRIGTQIFQYHVMACAIDQKKSSWIHETTMK